MAQATRSAIGSEALRIRRYFTTEGIHPYDEIEWELRDAIIQNYRTGEVAFEQKGVEVPKSWSQNATNIVAQKYFRGSPNTPQRETSVKQMIDRVVNRYHEEGFARGYFSDPAEADIFRAELTHLLVNQKAAFNSPVWFNVGWRPKGEEQVSACQPYDALVSTPDGLIPIGKLVDENAIGTKVFDAEGVTKIVAVKANGVRDVLRIHTKVGYMLDVTADHLVWKRTSDKGGRFVPAGELNLGDKLEWYRDDRFGDTEIESIEQLGAMEVFDIQTESGEYVSEHLRVHNCFILSVDDEMSSILNWYVEEGTIFKHGSGAGVNLSKIRSSKERLQSGGTASGPVSFMRGADASAGTIKSGGATRRAAKMVVLNVDHPDVRDFIWCKALEEKKALALREAGFDMDLDGKDTHSIQYQNANNSVRVTDEFMQAVVDDTDWSLRAVKTGEPIETLKAKELFREIAQAAWECADPGMQYDTVINDWHTCPETDRINGSNPCSEYMHVDNSSCNLASLNLLKFIDDNDNFDVDAYKHAVEVMFLAQEISVGFASYPTERIADNSHKMRQLGQGFANLGALLMSQGLAYDSDEGRAWAASLMSIMTGHCYATSAKIAERVGVYEEYPKNKTPHLRVMNKHRDAAYEIPSDLCPPKLVEAARSSWDEAVALGETHGYRNAQATVLAPTGTIGLLMDCDTTGIEPDLALKKMKKLVGGGTMSIVNQTVPRALRKLDYSEAQVAEIVAYIDENSHVVGSPLRDEHLTVFDTAMGERSIHYMGHIRMMGAVQPFISGAISKTVNLPEDVTVEDVEQVYIEGWRLGIKALALYRDNCKVAQPLSSAKKEKAQAPAASVNDGGKPVRRRLPQARRSMTFKFRVADTEGYLTAGEFPEGGVGEIFLRVAKQGSTLAGIMDAFAVSISMGLQYGVPLSAYVKQFSSTRFEPSGMTDDPDFRIATSILDYVFRRLAAHYLLPEERHALGIRTAGERQNEIEAKLDVPAETTNGNGNGNGHTKDEGVIVLGPVASAASIGSRPYCGTCGVEMNPAGSCFACPSCGSTSGCS